MTLTYEHLREMQRQIHRGFVIPAAHRLMGMQIIEDQRLMVSYTEMIKFKGHPIVQYLSKWLHFDPDVTAIYMRYRPSPDVIRFGDKFVMHPATAKQLREHPLVVVQ